MSLNGWRLQSARFHMPERLGGRGCLNLELAGVICERMSRLRARVLTLILLITFGIGLVGPFLATHAVAMPQAVSHTPSMSMDGSDGCPGCAVSGLSPVMKQICIATLCAVAPGILAQAPIVSPSLQATFLPVASYAGQGVTVSPALGPPRTTVQS